MEKTVPDQLIKSMFYNSHTGCSGSSSCRRVGSVIGCLFKQRKTIIDDATMMSGTINIIRLMGCVVDICLAISSRV